MPAVRGVVRESSESRSAQAVEVQPNLRGACLYTQSIFNCRCLRFVHKLNEVECTKVVNSGAIGASSRVHSSILDPFM